jgi:4-hydroxybutyryl-CoA dehydratase/vinylacetyl-CoA-Delta-isomerase
MNAVALTYDYAHDPQYEDLLTAVSHLSGKKINRFCHIHQSVSDLVKKSKMGRLLGSHTGCCFQRCVGMDALNALSIVTYDIDRKHGTDYNKRFLKYLAYVQENDLTCDGAMTDPKGDRSLPPHQQKDPDLYLRVVERRKDGIVVRGAKAHISAAAYFNEIFVVPCRNMSEKDGDYAVSFAIPVDTPGVIQVAHPIKADFGPLDFPVDIPLRWHTDSLVIFDDVFVPWERVFLCGEWAFAMPLVYNFAYFHRHTAASYRVPVSEMMVGMAQAMAEYNGVDKATHIIEKITDLVIYVNMLKSLSRAACVDYVVHGGIPTPNPVITNMAKYYFASNFHRCVEMVQDVAGGLLSTAPTYADFTNPEIGAFIERYLGGAEGTTAEQRLRMLQFIRRILCQEIEVLAVQGEGSFQAQRMTIYLESQDEIQQYKRMTEKEAGIKPA